MRITLDIEGDAFEIEVGRAGGRVRVRCDEESWDVEGRRTDASVELGPPMAQRVSFPSFGTARIGTETIPFDVLRLDVEPSAAATEGGGIAVRAVMPGRLVRVLAHAGQSVQRGTPLFVLEAMKMQNELVSPTAGTIIEVAAHEGEVVEIGRLLARVGPE